MADTLVLGTSAARRVGSSPTFRTNLTRLTVVGLFFKFWQYC